MIRYPNLPLLIDSIIEVYDNPAYTPRYGKTYCNIAVHDICCKFGYREFSSMLANQMYDQVKKDKKHWSEFVPTTGKMLEDGWLIIAIAKGKPHGHVVVLRPGIFDISGKWGRRCPKCLNIGKNNDITMGTNWAFDKPPEYYIYTGEKDGNT